MGDQIGSGSEHSYTPRGVLVACESISGDGEHQSYYEVVVTLETGADDQPSLEIRLGDKKNTILMVKLSEVEGALKLLKGRRK